MTLQQLRYVLTIAGTNSMNEAAKQLYISQPSLSAAVKELETEIDLKIFSRTSKGVVVTNEGMEFLAYARQIMSQVELLEERFLDNPNSKKKFGVSTQHYSFAVQAFVEMAKQFDMNDYEFAIRETRTADVMNDVRLGKSEIGVLYVNQFNENIMSKLFRDQHLIFTELFSCDAYVYLYKGHPLANQEVITMEDLEPYPCLSFEQGENNSFYFAEEILSTYEYKKTIKACDRATMLNLMVGLNGYTLCSGIISEELNGSDYVCVPLETEEEMRIGYVSRKGTPLSAIGELYVSELLKFKEKALKI